MLGFNVVIVVLMCGVLTHGQEVNFKDCGSQVGKIDKFEVFPCTKFPCLLKKGQSYTINVTFTITESTDQSFAKVYGVIAGVKVPFPIDNKDACKGGFSGLNCPLKSGSTLKYTATLPIKKIYPNIKVLVEWNLTDKDGGGNKIFCAETLVQITS